MMRCVANSVLIVVLFLTGCRGPQIAFCEMDSKPEAFFLGHTLKVCLGVIKNIPVSEVWFGHKTKVAGDKVFITGYQSFFQKQSNEFQVQLPLSVRTHSVSVVWVDPDGSHVNIPITQGFKNRYAPLASASYISLHDLEAFSAP